MKRLLGASLVLGAVIGLVGCAPALNEETACELIDAYSSEGAELIRQTTDNLADDTSRNRFAMRLTTLGTEVGELSIADEKLSETTLAWAEAMAEFGAVLTADSVEELKGEARRERYYAASDEFIIQDSTIRRLCKL
jgi:hypothetical protein